MEISLLFSIGPFNIPSFLQDLSNGLAFQDLDAAQAGQFDLNKIDEVIGGVTRGGVHHGDARRGGRSRVS
jgi:hypothetical protein